MTVCSIFIAGVNGRDYWVDGSDQEEEMNFVYFDGSPMPLRAPFWGSTVSCVNNFIIYFYEYIIKKDEMKKKNTGHTVYFDEHNI